VDSFADLKVYQKHRYILYRLSEGNDGIILEKASQRNATYAELLEDLPSDDPRYIVYDYEYKDDSGALKSKLALILWAPSIADNERRVLIESVKKDVKARLPGIQFEYSAVDLPGIQEQAFKKAIKGK
jgi:cofilin